MTALKFFLSAWRLPVIFPSEEAFERDLRLMRLRESLNAKVSVAKSPNA